MPESVLIALNTAGLGLLGAGLAFMYFALESRSKTLSESVRDLKDANGSVMEALDRRASIVDRRFQDEIAFRDLYLGMLKDSENQLERVKSWRDSEIAKLTERVKKLAEELDDARRDLRQLVADNDRLRQEVAVTQSEFEQLKRHIDRAALPSYVPAK